MTDRGGENLPRRRRGHGGARRKRDADAAEEPGIGAWGCGVRMDASVAGGDTDRNVCATWRQLEKPGDLLIWVLLLERFPVGGGEGDLPEFWGGLQEFAAYGADVAAHGLGIDDAALLLLLGDAVGEREGVAGANVFGEIDEGAVGVDGEGFGFFAEGAAVGGDALDVDGDLEEDALAAAALCALGFVRLVGHRPGLGAPSTLPSSR